jgi:hypothetical protein
MRQNILTLLALHEHNLRLVAGCTFIFIPRWKHHDGQLRGLRGNYGQDIEMAIIGRRREALVEGFQTGATFPNGGPVTLFPEAAAQDHYANAMMRTHRDGVHEYGGQLEERALATTDMERIGAPPAADRSNEMDLTPDLGDSVADTEPEPSTPDRSSGRQSPNVVIRGISPEL